MSKPPWLSKIKPKAFKGSRNGSKLYGTWKWRQYSIKKRTDDPQCKMCGIVQYDIRNLCVDHKIPVNQKGAIWDERNHQILCKVPCHAKKSANDRKKYSGLYAEIENGERIPI
jgi:5-methylcytosine-specific restriction endonuclease McrA